MIFCKFKYIPISLFLLVFFVSPVLVNALNVNVSGNDTIIVNSTPQNIFSVPEQFKNTLIDFRINTDINYLSFNHFVGNESLKLFFQAWLKEKELKNLLKETDSLRHIYSTAEAKKKEEITTLILLAEQKSMALNQEIPEMYEQARRRENGYWQTITDKEKSAFIEKIKIFADSLEQVASANEKKNSPKEAVQADTLVLFQPTAPTSGTKTEEASDIVYKIQIGAFKNKIPDTANKLIKKLSLIRNIEKQTDSKGVTIYTTGNLKSYQEAVVLQNQVKQEGAKNPLITAYKNGIKITIEEAKSKTTKP